MESPVQETPSPQSPQAAPDKQELKREVLDFIKLVVWFLIIFIGLRTYVIEGYEVQGESMEPTLANNERILVFKLPHELSKLSPFRGINAVEPGDIIVFDSPDTSDKRYVKRVIAMGSKDRKRKTVDAQETDESSETGEGVHVLFDRGDVYVDNQKIEEEYLSQVSRRSDERRSLLLDNGELYVLGDNRNVSKDSRSFNAISDGAVIGKAVIRFWPPSKIAILR